VCVCVCVCDVCECVCCGWRLGGRGLLWRSCSSQPHKCVYIVVGKGHRGGEEAQILYV